MQNSCYSTPYILPNVLGSNRALAPIGWEGKIVVPKLVLGGFSDVRVGESLAFVSEEEGVLRECRGLANLVRTNLVYHADQETWSTLESPELNSIPTTVFDNHNHALYFWHEAYMLGHINRGATVVHIDEHSDLWENPNRLVFKGDGDLENVWDFVNHKCNVGNYILPAIAEGLVGEVVRIEGEEQMISSLRRVFDAKVILNLDLDIFSTDLDDISFELKARVIRHFAKKASLITIATSPFFIDQERAIECLHAVFPEARSLISDVKKYGFPDNFGLVGQPSFG